MNNELKIKIKEKIFKFVKSVFKTKYTCRKVLIPN